MINGVRHPYNIGFENEDEFHFFFVCPLYNRPRAPLQNAISHTAPLYLKALLFGSEEVEETEKYRNH